MCVCVFVCVMCVIIMSFPVPIVRFVIMYAKSESPQRNSNICAVLCHCSNLKRRDPLPLPWVAVTTIATPTTEISVAKPFNLDGKAFPIFFFSSFDYSYSYYDFRYIVFLESGIGSTCWGWRQGQGEGMIPKLYLSIFFFLFLIDFFFHPR